MSPLFVALAGLTPKLTGQQVLTCVGSFLLQDCLQDFSQVSHY